MTRPILLPSFAAGELAPALQGRVDLAKYQVGLATCLNWFVHPFGGVSTRAGTAFVGEVCDSSVRSRLIPFSFNTQQTYVLEFGDRKMRVVKEGGYVLETGVAIAGITRASPGIVTMAAPHGLSSGDAVWLDGIVGMGELNRRRFTVTVVGASSISIGIDTSGYGDWTGGGTAARVYTVATPYPEADLRLLKYVQSADTMTLTHPSHAPRNLTRSGHASWSLTTITYAPTQQPPTSLATTSAGSGYDYVVTAVSEETGEESVASASVSSGIQTSKITWADAAGANSYNVYKGKNGVYGFIGRAGDGTTGFTDTTVAPDTSDTPPEDKNPFDAADKYPGCSTYHEGRQWYGRTNEKPQTLWSSASAAFNNMNTSSPSKDSDAITRTIASREVNEIRHLLSLNVLLVWTSGAVWKAWAGAQADVMTPANCAVKPQSYEGVSNVPPIATESAALYVTASSRKVRDVAYDYGSDSWAGRNVSNPRQPPFRDTWHRGMDLCSGSARHRLVRPRRWRVVGLHLSQGARRLRLVAARHRWKGRERRGCPGGGRDGAVPIGEAHRRRCAATFHRADGEPWLPGRAGRLVRRLRHPIRRLERGIGEDAYNHGDDLWGG